MRGRFKISTRIFVGFAALIVLTLFLAVFGVYQLSDVGSDAGKMSALASTRARVLDARYSLEAIRRAETRIRLDAEPSAFKDTADNVVLVEGLLTAAGQAALSEERRQMYASVLDVLHTHQEAYGHFIQLIKTAVDERGKLSSVGGALVTAADHLVEAARATKDGMIRRSGP